MSTETERCLQQLAADEARLRAKPWDRMVRELVRSGRERLIKLRDAEALAAADTLADAVDEVLIAFGIGGGAVVDAQTAYRVARGGAR